MNIHENPEVGGYVYEYLTPAGVATTPGDGVYAGANWNAIGDYTAAGLGTVFFEKGPAGNDVWRISRMIVSIEALPSIQSAGYGNGAWLQFGILVQIRDVNNTVVRDLTGGVPIFSHRHWQRLSHDAAYGMNATTALGTSSWHLRWTFSKRGAPIHLRGDRGERLSVMLRDDISARADSHSFIIQGVNEGIIQ